MNPLAAPLTLPNGHVLPNRIAKSAMSESLAAPDDAAPNDRLVRLYTRWATSGAGLLMTGNVMVARDGRGEPGNVVVEDERHLPALARWADAAQSHGAQLWMQINHGGRQAPRQLVRTPVAPSAVPMRKMGAVFATPRALTHDEVRAMVDRFGVAAGVAQKAGFSGVQLHGAHGYLVSQFLSPLTNLRDDAWGGDPERRMHFLLEVVRSMRSAVGARFPIGVKLNSSDFQKGGMTIEDATAVVRALEREGVDLVEVSGGSYEAPAMVGGDAFGPGRRMARAALSREATSPWAVGGARQSTVKREAYFLEAARAFRAVTTVPLMLTGGMRTNAVMTSAVTSGDVDVVGLARPMAYQPDLPAQILGGATGAQSVKLSTGIKLVDNLLEIYWYQLQLDRMGAGLEPDAGVSRVRALLHAAGMSWTHRASKNALPPTSLTTEATARAA